jgi:RNA polymerase sigma-70 factor, ECF subfamily
MFGGVRPPSQCLRLQPRQQAARFEGRSAVTTWLLTIARFKALSACRRRTDAPLDETIETTLADSADDPEMVLQKKSRSELVRQALTTLSTDHHGNH